MKTLGDDFFSTPDGAIYSKEVGTTLNTTWNENVTSDFGDFQDNFDSWVTDANAEGVLLENFHADVMSAYNDLLNGNNNTGAYTSSDAGSALVTPEKPVDADALTDNIGDTVNLGVDKARTILGALPDTFAGLSDADQSMVLGCVMNNTGKVDQWPQQFKDLYDYFHSLSTDIRTMQDNMSDTGSSATDLFAQVLEDLRSGEGEG